MKNEHGGIGTRGFDMKKAMSKTFDIASGNLYNPSGIRPTEYKVLIRPKPTEGKSKGGIILPDETKDRKEFAQMEGELVAISPLAFTYANESEWNGADKPKPGDRVLFAKYAGALVKGSDGVDYRLVNDKDIAAVLA